MSCNSNAVNRRIILTAEQLSSCQQSNELLQAELANRNEYQQEAANLQDIEENENYLLGYN